MESGQTWASQRTRTKDTTRQQVVLGYCDGLIPVRSFIDKGQGIDGGPHNIWLGADKAAPEKMTTFAIRASREGAAVYVIPGTSIPGVFKTAIDWTKRPAKDIGRVFGGKPDAVLGASPGGFGTILSQDAWLSVLRTLGTRPWCEGRLMVTRAGSVFDDQGRMPDEAMLDRLKTFLEGFVAFANAQSD